jgi:hypothetical protein
LGSSNSIDFDGLTSVLSLWNLPESGSDTQRGQLGPETPATGGATALNTMELRIHVYIIMSNRKIILQLGPNFLGLLVAGALENSTAQVLTGIYTATIEPSFSWGPKTSHG